MVATGQVLPTAGVRKPLDSEIDFHGLTHVGKVRKENQDHFLMCSLHKQLAVHFTSLPGADPLPMGEERLAFLAMVADGVGGGQSGQEASRLATEIVTRYVLQSIHCYYTSDASDAERFPALLEEAALRCHADLMSRAEADPALRGMATTLTLWLGLWPCGYLLQVGDSRYYLLRDGQLMQISRDQTMAQALVDQGILRQTDASNTRWAHVLASSIGGSQSAPVVTQFEQRWGDVNLLCSDGLTRYVPDDRIAERLRGMTSARQCCEALLQDALDAGGKDNITILVGRSSRSDQA